MKANGQSGSYAHHGIRWFLGLAVLCVAGRGDAAEPASRPTEGAPVVATRCALTSTEDSPARDPRAFEGRADFTTAPSGRLRLEPIDGLAALRADVLEADTLDSHVRKEARRMA